MSICTHRGKEEIHASFLFAFLFLVLGGVVCIKRGTTEDSIPSLQR